jgi:hypothetical protein
MLEVRGSSCSVLLVGGLSFAYCSFAFCTSGVQANCLLICLVGVSCESSLLGNVIVFRLSGVGLWVWSPGPGWDLPLTPGNSGRSSGWEPDSGGAVHWCVRPSAGLLLRIALLSSSPDRGCNRGGPRPWIPDLKLGSPGSAPGSLTKRPGVAAWWAHGSRDGPERSAQAALDAARRLPPASSRCHI